MNYRHAYHAGNFADVVKHVALVALLTHLRKKEKPFAVIETHAGRGLYDLAGTEAAKTSESEGGIRRLQNATDAPPPLLDKYLEIVRGFGKRYYPGSPLIAAKMLRPQDRLVAIEKHPQESVALWHALAPFNRTRVVDGDGYETLTALLPPPERRGLVLIDPPYEAPDEFERATRALSDAFRRFATGIYALWFPIKSTGAASAFCGEALSGGIAKALRIDIDAGTAPNAGQERLRAAGLLVVNPPFGFADEMRNILPFLATVLAQGKGASARVEWLAGEGS